MDFSKLTPEQKAELKQQFEAEEKAKLQRQKSEKENYKQLKNAAVEKVFAKLLNSSHELEIAKTEYYDEFNALTSIKDELYGIKDGQKSHTWTNDANNLRIITGFNEIDLWDDTKGVGLAKINKWLDSKVTEANKSFVSIIRELLKPNANGDLKANRVLDLMKVAEEIGDPELREGVNIIHESRKTVKSNTYIKAQSLDENGEWQWLPLSFSNV